MKRRYEARPSSLAEVRRFIRDVAADGHLPEEMENDFVLAVSEACANSVLHSRSSWVEVEWQIANGVVQALVRDGGTFRRRVRMPEIEGTRGHGIPLMMALMDEVAIREGRDEHPGTTVRLVRHLTG